MIDLRTYDDTLFRVDEVLGEKMREWLKFDKRFFYEQDDFNRAFLAQTFDVEPASQSLEETKKLLDEPLKTYFFEGTFFTLQKALKSFYGDSTLKQWFSYGGEPYHFKVEIDLKDDSTDETRYKKLDTLIEQYKNVRSVFKGFNLIRNTKSEVFIGANETDKERLELFPSQIPSLLLNAPLSTSAAYAQSEQVSVYPYKVRDISLNLERFGAVICEFIEDVNLPPMQSENLNTRSTAARFSGGAVTIDEIIKI
jgi:putative phage tail protein|nr:MAG TPA: tail protein [Caudoviricetes sp.]